MAAVAHRRLWLVHAAAVSVLLVFVCGVCGLPLWQYVLFFVYPGLSLTLVTSNSHDGFGRGPYSDRCTRRSD